MRKVRKLADYLPKRDKILHTSYHKMPHYIYQEQALDSVKYEHRPPQGVRDHLANWAIKAIRGSYDLVSGYHPQKMTIKKWIQRCVILETVAGVPGMVGGMARHLRSLRIMERDRGWIHHLLEEADNQRFHLFVFLNIKQPGILERIFIILTQGIFFNFFFAAYLLSPRFCHRFVGYLEEEAVKTYTGMLNDINDPNGVLYNWNTIPAPQQAIDYYQLEPGATYKQLIKCIRADEACHRGTNHFLADIDNDYEIEQDDIKVVNEQIKPELMSLKKQTQKTQKLKQEPQQSKEK